MKTCDVAAPRAAFAGITLSIFEGPLRLLKDCRRRWITIELANLPSEIES